MTEKKTKRRTLFFFAFLLLWAGMYFVAYYAMGRDDTVVHGIVVGLLLAASAVLAAIVLYGLSVLLRLFLDWIFEKSDDPPATEIFGANFGRDGTSISRVLGEFVGRKAKAKVAEIIKNNGLTESMSLILRDVESRIDAQIKSEGRALKALDKLNAAYKDCKDAGISPPDELRRSAIAFWGVVEAGDKLHKMTARICAEIEKTLAIQRVMDLPPYPDLYADAIGEDIGPLLDAVKERRENLRAAWDEVEEALKTYDVPPNTNNKRR